MIIKHNVQEYSKPTAWQKYDCPAFDMISISNAIENGTKTKCMVTNA